MFRLVVATVIVLHKIIHQYVWYEIKIQYWHLHRRFAIIPSPSMYNIIGRIQPTLQLHNIHIYYTSTVLELGLISRGACLECDVDSSSWIIG